MLRPQPHPSWVVPMLAKLTDRRFSDPDWIFEHKLDGFRCLAFRDGDTVRLMSRNQLVWDDAYPQVAAALRAQSCTDFVVDGELVAYAGQALGFGDLQQRAQRDVGTAFFVFDIMHWDGHDTTQLPQAARKKLLQAVLHWKAPLHYSEHTVGDGEKLYAQAAESGWEGIIAKDARSPYVHGRSDRWLKMKCNRSQELVVGGFTEPKRARVGLGALLVGHFDDGGSLRYAGKVGTGYDTRTLLDLRQRLDALERPTPPFADAPRMRDAHWVEPALVVQVEFMEWTASGKLRHPKYLGLRPDKAAAEVKRE